MLFGTKVLFVIAAAVSPLLTVNAELAQTITFGPLADKVFGDAPFALSATASSGLPVSFSIVLRTGCALGRHQCHPHRHQHRYRARLTSR